MNLEMPSPAEADSLRTILLIVLGVMILTIPVVCVIVVSKVVAQRKQLPAPGKLRDRSSQDPGGMDPLIGAGGSTHAAPASSYQVDGRHRGQEVDHPGAADHPTPASGGESVGMDNSSSFGDGGSSPSDTGGSSGGGDSGGGGSSD